MYAFSKRSGAVALLIVGAALTPAACATNNSSIAIRAVLAINHTACTFQAATTSAVQLLGSIDPAYAEEYVATLLVENQMVPLGDPNTLKTETDSVQLNVAEVQILDPTQGNSVITSYSVPVSGFIDPSLGGTDGLGLSAVVMLDAATVQREVAQINKTGVTQQVVSTVILQGQTLGNLNVHTQKFFFPITIVAPGSSCAAPMTGSCVGGTSSSMGDCAPGIDESTSCQTIAAQRGVCGVLECTKPGDHTTAHCPVNIPPDNSCCP
jgi:hypothetical protein